MNYIKNGSQKRIIFSFAIMLISPFELSSLEWLSENTKWMAQLLLPISGPVADSSTNQVRDAQTRKISDYTKQLKVLQATGINTFNTIENLKKQKSTLFETLHEVQQQLGETWTNTAAWLGALCVTGWLGNKICASINQKKHVDIPISSTEHALKNIELLQKKQADVHTEIAKLEEKEAHIKDNDETTEANAESEENNLDTIKTQKEHLQTHLNRITHALETMEKQNFFPDVEAIETSSVPHSLFIVCGALLGHYIFKYAHQIWLTQTVPANELQNLLHKKAEILTELSNANTQLYQNETSFLQTCYQIRKFIREVQKQFTRLAQLGFDMDKEYKEYQQRAGKQAEALLQAAHITYNEFSQNNRQ